MKRQRRWMPHKDEILAYRWLKPLRPYLSDDNLWELNRQSVARGVAIGLFFGFILPIAQCVFAVIGAVFLKGHVPISAACTLITNPLTTPPIYWLAYQIGALILPGQTALTLASMSLAPQDLAHALSWLVAAGIPLMMGLLVLATASAVIGYLGVWLLWRAEQKTT